MQRLVLAFLGFLAVSNLPAVAQTELPLPRDAEAVCVVRGVTADKAGDLIVLNATRDPLLAEVAATDSGTPAPVFIRRTVGPGEAISIADLLSIRGSAVIAIAGDERLMVVDAAAGQIGERLRKMRGTRDITVDRPDAGAVPFFVANAGTAPLHIEIAASDGSGRASREIGAGSFLEDRDLFHGFDDSVRQVAVRAASEGAEYFARFGVAPAAACALSQKPAESGSGRHRAVKQPRIVADCAQLEPQYQEAVAEGRSFAKTPLTYPSPPSVAPCCSAGDYSSAVMRDETARIAVILELERAIELMGCEPDHSATLAADLAPLTGRLARKEKALADSTEDPSSHPAVLQAMLAIERYNQLLGVETDPQLIANAVTKWLPGDVAYYKQQLGEQHDYTAVVGAYNTLRAMDLLTDVLQPADIDKYLREISKLLRFRMRTRIEGVIAAQDIAYFVIAAGETTVDFSSPDRTTVQVELPMSIESVKIVAPQANETCTTSAPPFMLNGLVSFGDACGTSPITVSLLGPFGGAQQAFMCTVDGHTGATPRPIPVDLNSAVRISFNSMTEPLNFDGKKQHAPEFRNMSAEVIHDVWSGKASLGIMELNSVITIIMTHEPGP
jgi:hypothetical protein